MLTDAQRRLVEDNMKLSYQFTNQIARKNKHVPKDDLSQMAAMGLCVAAQIFTPEKGIQFSTLAYTCMLNEYRKSIRNRNKSVKAVSFETPVPYSDFLLGDLIADMADAYHISPDAMDVRMDFDRFMKTKSDGYQRITKMAMTGMSGIEIARLLGISNSYVSYVLKKVRRDFTNWYQAA